LEEVHGAYLPSSLGATAFIDLRRSSAVEPTLFVVMPALVAGIHVFRTAWMAGTSSAMTRMGWFACVENPCLPPKNRQNDRRARERRYV
jgi:hypothetical protein